MKFDLVKKLGSINRLFSTRGRTAGGKTPAEDGVSTGNRVDNDRETGGERGGGVVISSTAARGGEI